MYEGCIGDKYAMKGHRMEFLKKHGAWWVLNIFVVVIVLQFIGQVLDGRNLESTVNRIYLDSGKWAIRFLLVSLAITPLANVLGWRWLTRLRKTSGLWAFGFGMAHFLFFATQRGIDIRDWDSIFDYLRQTYIFMAVVGLSILTALALTSNRWAMRWLGQTWKKLHRWVYVAGILVIFHALIAIQSSKLIYITSGSSQRQQIKEMQLYLGIFVLLMVFRVPFIRDRFRLTKRKAKRQPSSSAMVQQPQT